MQLLDPLSTEQYEALKADIARRGVLVPVEYDEAGELLDGHHREQAVRELRAAGVAVPEYPRMVRGGMTQDEKREYVLAINLYRRHLGKAELKEAAQRLKAQRWSNTRIASAIGVSEPTVRRALSGSSNDEPELARVNGKDGKSYPARKPRTVIATNAAETTRALRLVDSIPDDAPDKPLTVPRAARLSRIGAREEARRSAAEPGCVPGADLRLGDFREALADLQAGSAALVATDPPYGEKYLPLYGDLGAFARRVLRPGGKLLVYAGLWHLPRVLSALGEHLEYVSCFALIMPGDHARIWPLKIRQHWKAILLYSSGAYEPGEEWIDNLYASRGPEKEAHDWQQSAAAMGYYLPRLSSPGDLVIDPFLGAGTTGAVALSLGRRFIGCDIDPAALDAAKERLRETRDRVAPGACSLPGSLPLHELPELPAEG